MDEYLGIVKLFAGTFAPRGWAFCDGSLLPINQNQALFAILGTTYGGNGSTNFALPDLRGRVGVGAGIGNGIPPIQAGQAGGSATVTVTGGLPAHTHNLEVSNAEGTTNDPTGNVPAKAIYTDNDGNTFSVNAYSPSSNGQANSGVISTTGSGGGGQTLNIMPPFLGMNYIICLQGIFPSRN